MIFVNFSPFLYLAHSTSVASTPGGAGALVQQDTLPGRGEQGRGQGRQIPSHELL